jgi:NADH:ubiquinone oxidoreductase subunit 6 (subunit J)
LIQRNAQWIWAALGTAGLFLVLGWIVYSVNWPVVEQIVPEDTITILGQELLTTYVIPFEIASVLLLAALVGSIIIGRERE